MYLYRWNIEKVEGYPEVNGLQQVVGVVGWELEVRDTSDHSVHYIRTETKLGTPSSEGFVDYLELSNEQVLQWVWDIVGKEAMELQAKQELDDLRNPKPTQLTSFGMPWKGSCCPDGTGMPSPEPGPQ
jgi:hypothetical protein